MGGMTFEGSLIIRGLFWGLNWRDWLEFCVDVIIKGFYWIALWDRNVSRTLYFRGLPKITILGHNIFAD